MKVSFVSDIGLVRDKNEDFVLFGKELGVFIIADGMGGHKGGEVASKEACEYLYNKMREQKILEKNDISDIDIIQLIDDTNSYIYKMSMSDVELEGMGTTIVLLLLRNNEYIIAHIGDSRAYGLSKSSFEQLTKDHSYVQNLVDLGKLTKEEARVHSRSNVITQALGSDREVKPQIVRGCISKLDAILLCTDGLSDLISDENMHHIIENSSREKIVENLLEEAKNNGGKDNISIILVDELKGGKYD